MRAGSRARGSTQSEIKKNRAILEKMLEAEGKGNDSCADCGQIRPRWASQTVGVFLCVRCAGIHRSLGVHISFVRSINLDNWTSAGVRFMQKHGNNRANAILEYNLKPENKPNSNSPKHVVEGFIHEKYVERKFVNPDGKKGKKGSRRHHRHGSEENTTSKPSRKDSHRRHRRKPSKNAAASKLAAAFSTESHSRRKNSNTSTPKEKKHVEFENVSESSSSEEEEATNKRKSPRKRVNEDANMDNERIGRLTQIPISSDSSHDIDERKHAPSNGGTESDTEHTQKSEDPDLIDSSIADAFKGFGFGAETESHTPNPNPTANALQDLIDEKPFLSQIESSNNFSELNSVSNLFAETKHNYTDDFNDSENVAYDISAGFTTDDFILPFSNKSTQPEPQNTQPEPQKPKPNPSDPLAFLTADHSSTNGVDGANGNAMSTSTNTTEWDFLSGIDAHEKSDVGDVPGGLGLLEIPSSEKVDTSPVQQMYQQGGFTTPNTHPTTMYASPTKPQQTSLPQQVSPTKDSIMSLFHRNSQHQNANNAFMSQSSRGPQSHGSAQISPFLSRKNYQKVQELCQQQKEPSVKKQPKQRKTPQKRGKHIPVSMFATGSKPPGEESSFDFDGYMNTNTQSVGANTQSVGFSLY